MNIALHIEGDRILTESGVEVGNETNTPELYWLHCQSGGPYTFEQAQAAFNKHLDAIGVVSRKELDEAVKLIQAMALAFEAFLAKRNKEAQHDSAK